MKQTEPNPWDTIEEKYAINSIVTGKVRNLTDFGAFIEVEEGSTGWCTSPT
jgi:small subunit ribosomal protein S1